MASATILTCLSWHSTEQKRALQTRQISRLRIGFPQVAHCMVFFLFHEAHDFEAGGGLRSRRRRDRLLALHDFAQNHAERGFHGYSATGCSSTTASGYTSRNASTAFRWPC